MSTDLATRDGTQQLTVLSNEQLQYIASTEFVPPGLRGNLPAILACVATGRALGIADMTALRSIHIIDGKATYSAELMVMLARQRGHSIQGSVSEGAAKVIGKRVDNGDVMEVEWTLAMADRAGLLGKSNWKKYPESMLWARAVSQLCRELFADCFAGATYTTEELGADVTDEQGVPFNGDSAAGTPFSYDHEEPLDPPLEQVLAAHAASDASPTSPASEAAPKPTVPQLKKLNVLVGQLRDQHKLITTKHLYVSVGRELPDVADEDLHWSPLRESLTRQEASALIDRLEKFATERVPA